MSRIVKFIKPRATDEVAIAAGLGERDIISMTTYPNGDVDLELKDSVSLPDKALETRLEKALGLVKKV